MQYIKLYIAIVFSSIAFTINYLKYNETNILI